MKKIHLFRVMIFLILGNIFSVQYLHAQNEVGDDELLGKHINPKFEKKKKILNNPLGLDFQLFGTSFHYASKINTDFFWGVEAGLFPNLFDWVLLAGNEFTKENTLWSNDRSNANVNGIDQMVFGHVFSRWKPENGRLEIDAGFKAAVYSRSGVDDLGITNFYGGYVKSIVGNKKIKIGVQFDFGNMSGNDYGPFKEFVIIASPLIRFNFRKTVI